MPLPSIARRFRAAAARPLAQAAAAGPSARRFCAGLLALSQLAAADAGPAPAAPNPPAAAGAPSSFKPTPEQLAALRIVTVERVSFRAEQVTEGRIALDGDRTTPVYSPYSGRVERVLAGPGDLVREGQPLAALQASEFVQGQSDLLAAQAAQAGAHAALSLAQTGEQRKKALYEIKAGSLQDWQQAQSDLAAAQATARTADASLAAVRNRLAILGKSEAEIDALGRAGQMSALAYVVAPIAGTVIDRQVGPGQYLQAGASSPAFTVADLSQVWLVASVRETDAPYVKRGQTLEVRVDALPGRVFTGRVNFVAPTLDPATRRLAVRAQIANAEGLLKPEMFASFHVIAGGGAMAPAVPDSGIIYEGAEAHVWVAGADGSLSLRPIRPGRSAHGLVEVLEGLRPGEKVVASGALFIDRAAQGD